MTDSYPGNSALGPEVKERVLSTFRQTVELYKAGSYEDTIVGCEFILKMDSQFEPAKRLMNAAQNPSTSIDTASLLPNDPVAEDLAQARAAFAGRDFQRAADLAAGALASDMMNVEAQRIASDAQERLEAAPFVEQFVAKCSSQIQAGNIVAARATLEKARALDPTHPKLQEYLKKIESTPEASATPSFVVDAPGQNTSSFVVDAPSSGGRSEAPASEFGFTFEEEPKFGFESGPSLGFGDAFSETPAAPTAPPPPPPSSASPAFGEAQTFDFATASVETTAEDQAKISEYLAQGDAAFERNDYAEAIDIWSRIFLIDVTNEQASERIDLAKKKRQDKDQQLETLVVAGTLAYERGDHAAARDKFQEVLRIDPDNFNASEYLKRIETEDRSGTSSDLPPRPSGGASPDIFDDDFNEPLHPAALPIPDTVTPKAKATQAPLAVPGKQQQSKKSTLPLVAIVAIVAVLAAGGFWGFRKFHGGAAGGTADTATLFADAQRLARQGKYDQAVTTLIAVKPDDPQHDRALEMIADLKKKKAEGAETFGGRSASIVFAESLQQARTAFDSHDYVTAKELFEKAASVRQLPADVRPIYEAAAQEVSKLDNAKALFNEANYAGAIGVLEPMLQQEPENKNIHQMLQNSHFDRGAMALRGEHDAEAIAEFDKVLSTNPTDELARRSREIAVRYKDQPKDLLYRIFVKYLPLR